MLPKLRFSVWFRKRTAAPCTPKGLLNILLILLIASYLAFNLLLSGGEEQGKRPSAWSVPYLRGLSVEKLPFLVPSQAPRIAKKCGPVPGRLLPPGGGRLGNIMFGYAATLGISRRLGMTLVLPSHSKLFDIFEVHADTIVNVTKAKQGIRYERFASAYDPKLLEIPCEKDIFVCCSLQSWKYFTGYENEIRTQFRFRPSIVSKAQSVWDSVIFPATKWNSSTLLKDQGSMRVGEPRGAERPVFVAVHVRRGDKAHHKQTIKMGHRVASEEYLQNGYRFFLNRYNNNVIFVVSSDDQAWVKKVLPSGISVFVSSNRPEVDMAVLSRCNHTLMTVGTYGWWVAWMVNGTTVYYKHLFQPGSYIAKHHNNTLADWVLPQWIGME